MIGLVTICFGLLMAGVWVTGWYLSAKLIITAAATFATGGDILEIAEKNNGKN